MILSALVLLVLQTSSPFWSHWGDGKAELSSYTVTQTRYGEQRRATVVLIYVTEPFYTNRQVKAERPRAGDPDVVQVLKLNRVKTFRTGIYDYSLMSSVFAPVNDYRLGGTAVAKGSPLKIAFSGQEWCGTVFHQLNRRDSGMLSHQYSYFESEGDTEELLRTSAGTYFADELFIAVRELLTPMRTGPVTLYPTLEYSRLVHTPLAPVSATAAKKNTRHRLGSSTVAATEWTVTAGQQVWRFIVEQAYPRRILAYEHRDGSTLVERGTLNRTQRLPYWELNSVDDEHYAKQLGVD